MVLVWKLEPERGHRLGSEISLHSVRIVIEIQDVHYYILDHIICYWRIMLAHSVCNVRNESKKIMAYCQV